MARHKNLFTFAVIMLAASLIVLILTLISIGKYGNKVSYFKNQPAESEKFEAPKTPFLEDEEAAIVKSPDEKTEEVLPVKKVLFEYVEVTDSCGPSHDGECLNVRSGPGTDFPSVLKLRNGVVLKISGKVERNDKTWFKIHFDEWLRYPSRVKGDWYVAADFVTVVLDEGEKNRIVPAHEYASSTKRIVIDRGEQMLYAYDGDELFMKSTISTGVELAPTPRGNFTVFRKMPSRYMQGPIVGITDQYYDLPGVPWNLYFTNEGAAIHGAYWHNSFGRQFSHGCVNLPPAEARKLYNWAELNTRVLVRD